MWVWVSLPYATFGIYCEYGKVLDAAPIGKWMVGKETSFVKTWILGKGGTYEILPKMATERR